MRLSQLRALAWRLGVGRYSAMLRNQLIAAIQVRATQVGVSDSIASSLETPAQALAPQTVFEPESLSPQAVDVQTVASLPTASCLETIPPAGAPQPVHEPLLASNPAVNSPSSTPQVVLAPPSPADDDPSAEEVGEPTSTWVTLLTRDPQWASVFWAISAADRDQALSLSGVQLALRLADVTDTADSDTRPQLLQEFTVDNGAKEWHFPVPLGDRDYRVELGYRSANAGWTVLARSSVTRIAAEGELASQPFASFSLALEEAGAPWLPPLPAPGLHERIYQKASAGRFRISQGSEGFHEQADQLAASAAAGGQHSGVGAWASGREASGAGMAARQRSFWLVADAELIVYGATDPAATLTVGDQLTPLSKDGTFRFHTAFPDGEQIYPIRALAADGEQQRSITIDFSRSTPHAKVNPKEDAVPEWF